MGGEYLYELDVTNATEATTNISINSSTLTNLDFTINCWVIIPNTEWFQIIVTVVCAFGIVGNILNLFILTRQQILHSMDRMEKSANIGLVALAVSDLMFCIAAIPASFLMSMRCATDYREAFWLYIRVYSTSVVNLFLMISTWLIVAMAINRYIAVCHPLRARETMDVWKTRLTIVVIYILSTLLTTPYFVQNIIQYGQDRRIYRYVKLSQLGYQQLERIIAIYVRWVWPILSDFIPFVILAYCNAFLIWRIRRSDKMRRQQCPGQRVPESSHRVTLTLIIIILMHFILVSPAEIMKYADPFRSMSGFMVALAANAFQTVNFAANFVLYISVSRRFRQTTKGIIEKCFRRKKAYHDRDSKLSSLLSSTGETWL